MSSATFPLWKWRDFRSAFIAGNAGGDGMLLFGRSGMDVELTNERRFRNGNVVLTYGAKR